MKTCDSVKKEESELSTNSEIKTCNEVTSENKLKAKSVRKLKDGHRDLPHRHGKKHKHRSEKHSRKKKKGVLFEGERVPYLVKQTEAQVSQSQEGETAAEQDDYVLRKLFKKSGKHLSSVFVYLYIKNLLISTFVIFKFTEIKV